MLQKIVVTYICIVCASKVNFSFSGECLEKMETECGSVESGGGGGWGGTMKRERMQGEERGRRGEAVLWMCSCVLNIQTTQ